MAKFGSSALGKRNELCACGSGKRRKHCCGHLPHGSAPSATQQAAAPRSSFAALMSEALTAQFAEKWSVAEELYRRALSVCPRSFNALHMLGVVRLQLGYPEDAARMLLAALRHLTTDYPPVFKNLGLCLAAIAKKRGMLAAATGDARSDDGSRRVFRREHLLPLVDKPRVSVIMPSYNHERFVGEALESVYQQTYRQIELIIIDDGSRDGSVPVISRSLAACQFPHRFIQRENKGSYATLNEGMELASGRYVAILNTDDRYAPERIEWMVRLLQTAPARWGFSAVSFIDEASASIAHGEKNYIDAIARCNEALYDHALVSDGFVVFNHAISTGNLFFERTLCEEIGRFLPLRYSNDWAFCLRAMLVAEPAFLDEPTYHYRFHGSNTIGRNTEAAHQEVDAVLAEWHRRLDRVDLRTDSSVHISPRRRRMMDWMSMERGAGHVIARARLFAYVEELGLTQDR